MDQRTPFSETVSDPIGTVAGRRADIFCHRWPKIDNALTYERKDSDILKSIVFALFFIALSAGPALAYVDFGTGSYVLQVLVASAVGGIFLVKHYLQRIKAFFTRKLLSAKAVVDDTDGPL